MSEAPDVTVNVETSQTDHVEDPGTPAVVVVEDNSAEDASAESAATGALVGEAIQNAGEVATLTARVEELVAIVTAQSEEIAFLRESQTITEDVAAAALMEAENASAPASEPELDEEPSREHWWFRSRK